MQHHQIGHIEVEMEMNLVEVKTMVVGKKEKRVHRKRHHGKCRDSLWGHGDIYNPCVENYSQGRHIFFSETQVYVYYKDEGVASRHTRKL